MTAPTCARCGVPVELPAHACLYRGGVRYDVLLCVGCCDLMYEDSERYFHEGWEALGEAGRDVTL